jgi:hypothetical protein
MLIENIPVEMRKLACWCYHKIEPDPQGGKPSRVPYTLSGAHARSNTPTDWKPFPGGVPNGFAGVSFGLTAANGIACIDLDHCRDKETGEIAEWALEIIDAFNTYTEVSGSGTGVHIFFCAKLPGDKGKKAGDVEIYNHAKIMAVTGDPENTFAFYPRSLQHRQTELDALLKRIDQFKPSAPTKPATASKSQSDDDWAIIGDVARESKAQTSAALETACMTKHGAHFTKRNKEKGQHDAKTYLRYSCDRFLKDHPPAQASPKPINTPDVFQPCDDDAAPVVMCDSEGHVMEFVEEAAPDMEVLDMPADVISGRLREIYEKHLSAFPRAYAYPSLLAMAANKVPLETNEAANIYVALVGPTHSGKSQAGEQSAKLLGVIEPTVTSVMAGSAEGLLKHLGEVDGAHRLVFLDELGHMLEKASIENASYMYVLSTAFYKHKLELVVAKQKPVNGDFRFSILGGLVEEKFGDLFQGKSLGGLYDRFIFGLCPKPFKFRYRPLETAALEFEPVAVRVSREVYEVIDEWIDGNIIENTRTAEIALRTAVICASIDGREKLDGKDLTSALEWARYQQDIQRLLLPNPGQNQNAKAENRVRNVLEKHTKPDEFLDARMIEQYGHIKRDFGTITLEAVLAAMKRAGEIECMDITSAKNGKVKKLVRLKVRADVAK